MLKRVQHDIIDLIAIWATSPQDLTKLLNDFGFSARIKGDHHIYYRQGIEEIINLQTLKGGKAKAYQVKQVRVIIFKYKLHKGV